EGREVLLLSRSGAVRELGEQGVESLAQLNGGLARAALVEVGSSPEEQRLADVDRLPPREQLGEPLLRAEGVGAALAALGRGHGEGLGPSPVGELRSSPYAEPYRDRGEPPDLVAIGVL